MGKINIEYTPAKPPEFRQLYLNSLLEPQEFFLERLVALGKCYEFSGSGSLGYLVIHESKIVELFINQPDALVTRAVLLESVKNLGASAIYVKSFDPLAMALESLFSTEKQLSGYLFRAYSRNSEPKSELLKSSPLEENEIDQVMEINDNFFDNAEEIRHYVESQTDHVFSYRDLKGNLIGCGITSREIEGREAVDIGMLVAPEHRMKGFGKTIIDDLKEFCIGMGDNPIAGCDAANIASRKTLEAAGFKATHHLYEYPLTGLEGKQIRAS